MVLDGLQHVVPGPRGVSDTTQSLYFRPPYSRGALFEVLDSAFVVFGAAHLAFAVDTISQEFKLGMISLVKGTLAFLNQVFQSGIDPRRLVWIYSFRF